MLFNFFIDCLSGFKLFFLVDEIKESFEGSIKEFRQEVENYIYNLKKPQKVKLIQKSIFEEKNLLRSLLQKSKYPYEEIEKNNFNFLDNISFQIKTNDNIKLAYKEKMDQANKLNFFKGKFNNFFLKKF